MTDPLELDALGTIVTPVGIDVSRLEVRAEYFQMPIPLEHLQARYPPSQILNVEPLVLKIAGNAHAVVFGFGATVFWQCDAAVRANVVGEIERLPEGNLLDQEVCDTLLILVDQPEERVGFREIRLQKLSLEHLKIISEALGQSVALRQSERSVILALKQTAPIVQALEARGALVPSAHNIIKTVGFTLAVRVAILVKLSLFDEPAETWRSERLARLHGLLKDYFDIKKRLSGLKEKVTFLSDLNALLLDLLQNRTSHRLEWIVILLIVMEVILSIAHFYSSFH